MNIIEVKKYDVANGPGVRCSIWTAGCNHYCDGCFSPHTWNHKQGTPYKELITEIDEAIQNENVVGISILGGEPFFSYMVQNDYEIIDLLKQCKRSGKSVWVWSGFTFEQLTTKNDGHLWQAMKECIDILIDGKFVKEKRNLNLFWRGSSNQRIIDIKNSDIGNIVRLEDVEDIGK